MNKNAYMKRTIGLLPLLLISLGGCTANKTDTFYIKEYDNKDKYEYGNRYFYADEEIKEIYINWIFGNVNISCSDTETAIFINETADLRDDLRMISYSEEGTLYVRYLSCGEHEGNIIEKDLEVTIPRTFDIEKIQCNSYDVDINVEANAKKYYMYCEKGNVNLLCDKVDYVYFSSKSAKVSLIANEIDYVHTDSTKANFEFRFKTFNLIKMFNDFGDFDLILEGEVFPYGVYYHTENGAFASDLHYVKGDDGVLCFNGTTFTSRVYSYVLNGNFGLSQF